MKALGKEIEAREHSVAAHVCMQSNPSRISKDLPSACGMLSVMHVCTVSCDLPRVPVQL